MSETGKHKAQQSRATRLRAALRENLKRRKAQARDRSNKAAPATADEPSEPGSGPDFRRNPGGQ